MMLSVLTGDALEKLRELPDESVQCCVTSPPYWGLRDYGTAAWEGGEDSCDHKSGRFERGGLSSKQASNNGSGGDEAMSECPKCGARRIDSQIGLEKTPEEYVVKMVEVFREVRRVLRRDGTLWLNLGDSFAANGISGLAVKGESSTLVGTANSAHTAQRKTVPRGLKPKDMVGIPWRVAFALQADGWWLRSDIIWSKPNPMPESVTDRPTKSHEYLFLLTKSANYFYDAEAIKEPQERSSIERAAYSIGFFPKQDIADHSKVNYINRNTIEQTRIDTLNGAGRNKRSVWTVATSPYPEAHFATYPPDLIKPCIMAGTSAKGCCAKCGAPWERVIEREVVSVSDSPRYSGVSLRNDSEDGRTERSSKTLGWRHTCKCDGNPATQNIACTVLDPFAGSGTTGAVALELGRKAILIELNPKYVALIEQRCTTTLGLALA